MGSVAALLARRPKRALAIGLPWTTFVFAETLCDLPAFAHDPHMLVEELALAGIHAALLALLGCEAWRLAASKPLAANPARNVLDSPSGGPYL
ncbi:MAG: hypothetical protein WD066_11450 [Planctomycetaceae bacterium]